MGEDTTEKPPSTGKISSFLEKPVTRRDLLKGAAVVGGAYLFKDLVETVAADPEKYKVPENFHQALALLEKVNLELPQDQLYGFTFPPTREMAQKYREALQKRVGDYQLESLIVVQKKPPRTFWGNLSQTLSGGPDETPRASRASSPDKSSFIWLPAHFIDAGLPTIASSLYHEGIHLFYQPPANKDNKSETFQEKFDSENLPTISDVLLGRLLESNNLRIPGFETDTVRAYERAVAENNKDIWEKEFKKLYQLPRDCCTYIPLSLPTKGVK